MLNVKTCEDSFFLESALWSTTKHTHSAELVYCWPTSGRLTTVHLLTDMGEIVTEKIASNIVPKDTTE